MLSLMVGWGCGGTKKVDLGSNLVELGNRHVASVTQGDAGPMQAGIQTGLEFA